MKKFFTSITLTRKFLGNREEMKGDAASVYCIPVALFIKSKLLSSYHHTGKVTKKRITWLGLGVKGK